LAAGDAAAEAYLREAMPSGTFHGWLAVTATGEAVGSGGAVIDRHPPGPGNLTGEIGYIMNVVTVPAYRRRGIARHVLETIVAWLEEKNIARVTLHATEMGRPLYRKLGFVDSNEMRLQRK
jgi:GNAT superfamily N-acetyltransferase